MQEIDDIVPKWSNNAPSDYVENYRFAKFLNQYFNQTTFVNLKLFDIVDCS